MIIVWVLSLLALLTSLISGMERMTTLEMISNTAVVTSGKQFIAAEHALEKCQVEMMSIVHSANSPCHLQSVGKDLWLISTKENPRLEILVHLDEKTGAVRRLNWRQQFD